MTKIYQANISKDKKSVNILVEDERRQIYVRLTAEQIMEMEER